MKLSEYILELNKLVKENPECLHYEVVYSADDEGNHYQSVHFTPCIGEFKERCYDGQWETETSNPNAVCLN